MKFARCFRAECLKLLTRPSISLTVLGVLTAGIALTWFETPVVLQMLLSKNPDLAPGASLENMGFDMVSACQLGMVAAGAMAASGEYREGGLRTSLLATPSRAALLTAQAAALALFSLVAATVSVVAISSVAQLRLGSYSLLASGIPSDLARDWAGAVLFWVASSLITFFLTHVFRSVVAPLFVMVCLSLSIYTALSLTAFARFLPTTAGILLFDPLSITASYPEAALSRTQAALVVAAWVLAAGCLSAALFVRRPGK
ncbi:MAG: ABC transporter permease [Atopobium sp.]|uniref:ABC transporter permease n=1 Tax=Atopobium sp. TaxID=1872650 RepID=UPI002A74ADCA|nr:ABC transporter permease [Atopobium sp.]MDY2788580.1 ABC transporter permease [Atopobium sp.]